MNTIVRFRRLAHAVLASLWACVLTGPVAFAQAPPVPLRPDMDQTVGWLGITIQDVGEELADQLASRFGPAAGIGVLVVEAMPNGPAAAA